MLEDARSYPVTEPNMVINIGDVALVKLYGNGKTFQRCKAMQHGLTVRCEM
jgi:hypothetical protein